MEKTMKKLCYDESGEEVQIGDTLGLKDKTIVVVDSIQKPHKPSSTGRVYVKELGASNARGYFPSVIGATWQEVETTMNQDEIPDHVMGQFHQQLSSLAYRWDDEKEYEDFNDYIKVIKNRMAELMKDLTTEYTFVKVTKKPFGIHYLLGDKRIVVKCLKNKITQTIYG